jgi:hypothetical protein
LWNSTNLFFKGLHDFAKTTVTESAMDDRKYIKKLLEISKKYELEKFSNINLKETHTAFEGTPQKHPHDRNILILLKDPFSNEEFYEFSIDSIGTIEDLGSTTSGSGETAPKIRVWIKKGMTALKSMPFIVK